MGLYLADETMRQQDGRIAFLSSEDIDLPSIYDGAAVALVFKEAEKK